MGWLSPEMSSSSSTGDLQVISPVLVMLFGAAWRQVGAQPARWTRNPGEPWCAHANGDVDDDG